MISLSVVIATYNRGIPLMRTLDSLLNQTLDNSLWEVVVVSNNSIDNTTELFEQFAQEHPQINCRLVSETRQGLSPARNRGIEVSQGQYIAIIDDDQEVNNNFAKAYYDFFEVNPSIVACGGKIVPLYEFETPKWLSPYAERPIAGTLDLGDKIRPFKQGNFPGGGNMAIRKSAIEKYGAFNPDLGRTGASLLAGEEKDLFRRLTSSGEAIYYLPDAVIYHIIPQSKFTDEYFDRVSYMGGISERVRTLSVSKTAYAKRLFDEIVKWGATILIALGYVVKIESIKGRYLIRMRLNITKGLLDL